MLHRFLLITLLMVFSFSEAEAQRCLRRLERWHRKGKYEKIVRKSSKILQKCKKEREAYFYLSWAELRMAETTSDYQVGYSHLLKSIRYFNFCRENGDSVRVEHLSKFLYSEINRYYKYFEESKSDIKLKSLDKVLVSIFGEPSRLKKEEVKTVSDSKPQISKEERIRLLREQIIEEALKHVGKPYKYAGKGPDSFDCSGFTRYVYFTVTGHEISHRAVDQSKVGRHLSPKEAMPGDLIFFGNPNSGKVYHAGIVFKITPSDIGGVIHSTNKGIAVDQEPEPAWERHWKDKIVVIVNILDEIVTED